MVAKLHTNHVDQNFLPCLCGQYIYEWKIHFVAVILWYRHFVSASLLQSSLCMHNNFVLCCTWCSCCFLSAWLWWSVSCCWDTLEQGTQSCKYQLHHGQVNLFCTDVTLQVAFENKCLWSLAKAIKSCCWSNSHHLANVCPIHNTNDIPTKRSLKNGVQLLKQKTLWAVIEIIASKIWSMISDHNCE